MQAKDLMEKNRVESKNFNRKMNRLILINETV